MNVNSDFERLSKDPTKLDSRSTEQLHQVIADSERKVREADDRFLAAHSGENCRLCNSGPESPFSMAFQPIGDGRAGRVVAYEALAGGPHNEPAGSVLDHPLHNNRYSIDQR